MAHIKLDAPLAGIQGIGARFVKHLGKLGITNVRELLFHFPFRYEDFSKIYSIAELEPNQQATVHGKIVEIDSRRSFRRRMNITEAIIDDGTGTIRAVWFNQPYLKNTLRTGIAANFAGKVLVSDGELYLSHPTHEIVRGGEGLETRHTARLVPIYPETRGLTSKGIRFLVQPILQNLEPLKEFIPSEILEAQKLPELENALRAIHFPKRLQDAESAKHRFAFENIFLLHLFNFEQKLKLAQEHAPTISADIEKLKAILKTLPFELTFSQKRSLWEIIQDLEKPIPMNRLLQGDVGSGKTVVAALSALMASMRGYQSAFMAPTEVLARQHFETLRKLFSRVPEIEQPTAALLTASAAKIIYSSNLEGDIKKSELHKKIADGEVAIIIGTQALIQKGVTFRRLGLVIIDEQHRFGVEQRAALLGKQSGTKRLIPHLLAMSATPIPRTIMLTVFGDLDVSTITELPSGRKPIVTKIVEPDKRDGTYKFIRVHVKEGRQVFVICPRIEPPKSDEQAHEVPYRYDFKKIRTLEVKSVKEEHEKLSKKIFPDLRIAMLHGQMKSKEKEKIMSGFRGKMYDILVSTSVIEVGVDIQNATIMMIEGSERFGLAQLYQFRGRVGRGEHQSYCFLFSDSSGESTKKRLKAILEAKNGFELAEKDLAIRGPGEFLGESQSGMPDLAMEGLKDVRLIKESREAAIQITQKDPPLKNYPMLQDKLNEFKRELLRRTN